MPAKEAFWPINEGGCPLVLRAGLAGGRAPKETHPDGRWYEPPGIPKKRHASESFADMKTVPYLIKSQTFRL
jgi:hypothetical protein